MDGISIRLPYRHLRETELELVALDDDRGDGDRRDSTSIPVSLSPSRTYSNLHPGSSSSSTSYNGLNVNRGSSMKKLILGSMVGAGVQFGWALQLSLLTPYIQTLGIQHAFSSFIWLCGPITGLIVQPCVGIWSDKCHLKLGKRRPFILAGCIMISFAVILIGFAADAGYLLGDTNLDCKDYKGPRWRAAAIFIIGFWLLDLANNTVQGPSRALLADLSGPDQCNSANAIFCSWMAIGNILGFSAGASGQWQRWFPFLRTKACCEACANLKGAFLVAVVFLMFCMSVTLYFAKEVPLETNESQRHSDSAPLLKGKQQHNRTPEKLEFSQQTEISGKANSNGPSNFVTTDDFNNGPSAVLVNLLTSLRHLPPGMHSVLLVMALTWTSWFPFFLFDTDWMGREVYHGDPKGNLSQSAAYESGVREGAFGLLLNSVVLGISSLLIAPMVRRMGSKLVWALSNFIVFICMSAITIISFVSLSDYSKGIQNVIGANKDIKTVSLILFSLLGFPLAVTYSVPFSVTAELTAGTGGGQGLATGVLNLAIVVPQMIVSLGAGPWDALFGGGNIPAFFLASVFSLAGAIVAFLKLPTLSSSCVSTGFHGVG